MKPLPSATSRPDFRTEALLCAIDKCATVTSDLLIRHPAAAALREQQASFDGRSLSKLLWQELADQERGCLGPQGSYYADAADGSAGQYFQRRLRLEGWRKRRTAATVLSAPWPQILELSAAGVRSFCIAIGNQMIARAFTGQPLQKTMAVFGPLGQQSACDMLERLRKPVTTPFPAAIAERWRAAFVRIGREATGDRIPSRLGIALLAVLYRGLSVEAQCAAVTASRSKLPEALQADQLFEQSTPEELTLARTIARALLPHESRQTADPTDDGGRP